MKVERLILILLAVVVIGLGLMLLTRMGGRILPVPPVNSAASGDGAEPPGQSLAPGTLALAPLTVFASSRSTDPRQTWLLSVNSARQAQLSDGFEKGVSFEVTQGDWDAFREGPIVSNRDAVGS